MPVINNVTVSSQLNNEPIQVNNYADLIDILVTQGITVNGNYHTNFTDNVEKTHATQLISFFCENFVTTNLIIIVRRDGIAFQYEGGNQFFHIGQNSIRTRHAGKWQQTTGAINLTKLANRIQESYNNCNRGTGKIAISNNVAPESNLENLKGTLSVNTILYGAPGTGKTFSVVDYAYAITNKTELTQSAENRAERKKDFDSKMGSQIRFVTFHQSFSYEEFVEGIRAETTEDGKINYFVKPGIFKEICKDAGDNLEENYVLIIDEINRGNISKIFGELITLIEESKRARNEEALSVTLPYSVDDEQFSVPNNLYIIGTMNTADRSLALMDTALRRRFNFIEMMPDPELLKDIEVAGVKIKEMLTTMNKRITVLYDREHTLGHAFFMPLIEKPTIENLANIFKNKIIPLLQEYFFDDWRKIRMVLGDDKAKTKIPFIETENLKDLFEDEFDDEGSISYTLNEEALTNAESYKNIYE